MVAELREGVASPADGAFAVASARRAKAWALNDMVRILQNYKELIVRGIPPPDEEEILL